MAFNVSATTGVEATIDPATLESFGYLKTSGREIVDAVTGDTVRLVGVNWHGAEGFTHVPGGMWARNYRDMMDQMADTGFNLLRIPVSPAVLTGDTGDAINGLLNPSLDGLSAIEVLDEIVQYAETIGMRVLLDMHRITEGVGKQENGLWVSDTYSEADLIADWQTLAARYAGNPTVIGADLFNEPSGIARWSNDDPRTPPPTPELAWSDAAGRIGNAIHEVNPDLLIFVEGVHIVDTKFYWVGGNLRGVAFDPVELNLSDKLVYSPHDYPYGVRAVPWLDGADAEQMIQNWDTNWGFLYDQSIAPVVIGETGSLLNIDEDILYVETLETYLQDKAALSPDGDGGISLIWWTWGPNSFDTGGILSDDWLNAIPEKLEVLDGIASPRLPTSTEAARAIQDQSVVVSLNVPTSRPWTQTYLYETMDYSAVAGQDYVAESGVLHLARNTTSAQTSINLISDDQPETAEEFLFRISTNDGAPLSLEKITILDDDDEVQGAIADPKVFVGGIDRSPGVWKVVLDLKDLPDPVSEAAGWTTTLYSDLFTLSSPVKGALTQVDDVTYDLSAFVNNGRWTNSLTAELAVPLEDLVGLETALIFADPFEPITGTIPADALSPTGALLSGDPELKVSIEVVTVYGTEFFARVTVRNDSDKTFNDWELKFRGPFDVSNVTKVSVLEQDEDWMFVKAPNWNNDLDPGEEFVFGLNADLDINPGDHIVSLDTWFF